MCQKFTSTSFPYSSLYSCLFLTSFEREWSAPMCVIKIRVLKTDIFFWFLFILFSLNQNVNPNQKYFRKKRILEFSLKSVKNMSLQPFAPKKFFRTAMSMWNYLGAKSAEVALYFFFRKLYDFILSSQSKFQKIRDFFFAPAT